MSVRTDVVSLFEQVAAQQKKTLAPLMDELVRLTLGSTRYASRSSSPGWRIRWGSIRSPPPKTPIFL